MRGTFIFLLTFLLFWNTHSDTSLKPEFTRFPEESFAILRKQLVLKCAATGIPFPSITWYKDGDLVQSQHDKPGTSNRIITQGDLLFLSFSYDDEGYYYCNASNVHGWTVSPSASVRVAFFNTDNVIDPESKTASVGDIVHLECTPPIGLPEPVFSWTHNGKMVEEDSRVKIESGILTINPVSFLDSGAYQCRATNIAGSWGSKIAQLTVQKKPRFRSTPGSKQVITGEDVELQCLASDYPNSTVIWRRDSGSVPRTSLINRKNLRIEDVHLSDAGNYICETKSPFGIVEAVSHLSVISPPSFLVTPDDREASVGDDVLFDCLTSGTPAPTVRWIHARKMLWVPKSYERPFDNGRYRLFPNGTLLIRSVSIDDEGIYECKASHMARIEKSSAYLYIRAFGVPPLPLIEIGPQNQSVLPGTIVNLPCQAIILRYPFREDVSSLSSGKFSSELSIEWAVNGIRVSDLNDPRIVSFPSGSLQINAVRLTDSGVYTCRAELEDLLQPRHSPHSTSWSAFIKVIGPSEAGGVSGSTDYLEMSFASTLPPPDGLSLSELGDSWIGLEVTGSPNITSLPQWGTSAGFRFELAEYGSSVGWWLAVPFTSERRVRISGLRPRTSYVVLVRHVHREIVGQPLILSHLVHTSDSAFESNNDIKLLGTVPDLFYFSPLQLRPISPSEVIAEWSLCSNSHKLPAFRNFRATVRAVSLSNCLTYDRDRSVVLRDENILHDSRCPSLGTLMERDDTRLPHCSISEFPKNAVLDRVPSQLLQKDVIELVEPLRSNSSFYRLLIDLLKPFICYTVEIAALIFDGNVTKIYKKSSSSSVLTYDNLPLAPPKVFSAQWIQNTSSLEISWNPPSDWELGGVLTGYKLRVIGSPPKLIREIKVGPDTRSFQFANLDPWNNYTIYLAALNCRGEGVRSSPVHVFAQSNSVLEPSIPFRRVVYDGRVATVLDSTHDAVVPSISGDLTKGRDTMDSLTREPWFIVGIVAFVLLWALIVIGLILCGRHRSRRNARSHDSSNRDNVAKNGRIISPENFTSPWTPLGSTEVHPLVPDHNFEGVYYGEKPMASNGYHALIAQNDGVHVSKFTNVSFPVAFAPGYTHGPHYPIGPQNPVYVSTANLSTNASNNVHLTPNGHLPIRYDRSANHGNKVPPVILDEEDTVTPYASVPVMQQMLLYDPSSSATTVTSRNQPDIHRQLSLAKIIPPPPDYPPPSLPSASPPPTSSERHLLPWSRAHESGSGEDSAYYAQSELQATPSRQSNRDAIKAPVQYSGSLPASDESSAFLPHESSHHSGSQLFPSESHFRTIPILNPLASGFPS